MSREQARAEARRVVKAAASESTAALLGEIAALLRRFVVMTPAQGRVVALWVVHTHLVDAAEATPYLAVTSAEKRSGKTRLLEVGELLVARPWLTGRTTAAVLPRKIDAESPTLLLDESDAAFKGDKEYAEALRGVLNTGHRRGGRSTVCVGQGANVGFKDFSTFCPKAIAGIGKLPDTVADRAIPIRLQRRAPGEQVDRFRRREMEPQTQQLRQRLAALADVVAETLVEARPQLPEELDDRAWDGIEPLLAIADLAGGDWPTTARAGCVELYGGRQLEDESTGIRLIADIQEVFAERDRITTAALLDALHNVDESPWADWFGKPITARAVAKLLRPYGIKSKSIQVEPGHDNTAKGYMREPFEDAWRRYRPHTYDSESSGRQKPHGDVGNGRAAPVGTHPDLTGRNQRNPASQAGSDVLTETDGGEAGRGAQQAPADARSPRCSCAPPGPPAPDGGCGRRWGWAS